VLTISKRLCAKSLYGKVYRMVWFKKLPLSKGPNVSENPFKRGFGKTKTHL
jgi:hypothetical protein